MSYVRAKVHSSPSCSGSKRQGSDTGTGAAQADTLPAPGNQQLILSLGSCVSSHLTATDRPAATTTKCCGKLQPTGLFLCPSPSLLLPTPLLFCLNLPFQGKDQLLHYGYIHTQFSAALISAKVSRSYHLR